jgi:hypothetical protein
VFDRLLLLREERRLLLLCGLLLLLQLLEVLFSLLAELLFELPPTAGDVAFLGCDLVELPEADDACVDLLLIAGGACRLHLGLHAADLTLQCREVLCRLEPLLVAAESSEEEPLIDELIDTLTLVSDRTHVRDLLLEETLLPCNLGLERLAFEDACASLLLGCGDASLQPCGRSLASRTERFRLLRQSGEVRANC